ncbi:glutathione synthase [Gorgonomyces haynaldii]|nr:glutathione synthase [Gorgonomyces haynaldii]
MNGLVMKTSKDDESTELVHAPFALYPSPFPKDLYERAKQIQPLFNHLVHQMAQDKQFLESVMNELDGSDEFTQKVYKIYQQTIDLPKQQPVWFGIHRSDYLIDKAHDYDIKQVELNTISASFMSLSSKISDLHKFLSKRTNFYNELSPESMDIHLDALPENISGYGIAKSIARAWKLYNAPKSLVLFIVQPGERNIADQRHIERVLFDQFNIKCMRRTLGQIAEQAELRQDRKMYINNLEIAVSYYRSGYTPDDYPTQKEWDARLLVEQSYSIKCPNAAYHLVGSKKVQQILAMPNQLERFVSDPAHLSKLRKCFTGLYPLDQTKEGIDAYNEALKRPQDFVLKPQREGGGNNFYGQDVADKLKSMSVHDRNGYILMDLIRTPFFKNTMVRNGKHFTVDVISELGIYGTFLAEGNLVHLNEEAGHLLRTKSSDSNEGGVASGYAVLDSPLFV